MSAPWRVVIADDDPDIRGLVAIAVKRAGLELVAAAADGHEALAALREHHPDLAVLDVSMPGPTGLEICRTVRADESFAGLTIVLLSAAVDEKSQSTGIEAGADSFLAKPFSPRELGARLSEIASSR